MRTTRLATLFACIFLAAPLAAQEHDNAFDAIGARAIGPAGMSGRVSDVEVVLSDPTIIYVGAGTGGVHKSVDGGLTWTPIFDEQPVYSIGCITLDPANPDVVWVGTGENVSGRHVGWGDGVYKSLDGGASWTNMGLTDSQHISRIVVDPPRQEHDAILQEP